MVSLNSIGDAFATASISTADKTASTFLDSTERFLKLFVTQLQYQNPDEPMDTAQMTQQLSTLSTVQQAIQSNKNLETLISMQSNSQSAAATSLIGKEVEYVGSQFYINATEGQEFNYSLDKEYKKVNLEITDGAGKVVFKKDIVAKVGEQNYAWDGKDINGNKLPAGKYEFAINALNEDDQYEIIQPLTKGVVKGVDFKTNGEPLLVMDESGSGVEISLGNVASVTTLSNNNQTASN